MNTKSEGTSSNVLTLDILDAAIEKIKTYRDRTLQEIRINPLDWRKAKDAFQFLVNLTGANVVIPGDVMWGIKVFEMPELPEGTMLLVYDEEHYVKVTNVGKTE